LHGRLDALFSVSSLTIRNRKWLQEAQVQPGQDAFDVRPEEVLEHRVNGLLKLRERNMRQRNAEMRFLLEDAGADEGRMYRKAIGETIVALSRLQRLLVSRMSATPLSSDDPSSWNN
jgi:hypothetical protein